VVAPTLGYLPKALVDRPQLYKELQFILNDFYMLSRSRSMSSSHFNAISIVDIVSYYRCAGINIEIANYIRLIQAADSAYMLGDK